MSRITKIQSLREYIYDFSNTNDWMDVGVQVLGSTGWRGDSTRPQTVNLAKCLPPNNTKGHIVVGNSENMKWYPQEEQEDCGSGDAEIGPQGTLEVVVGVFFQFVFPSKNRSNPYQLFS